MRGWTRLLLCSMPLISPTLDSYSTVVLTHVWFANLLRRYPILIQLAKRTISQSIDELKVGELQYHTRSRNPNSLTIYKCHLTHFSWSSLKLSGNCLDNTQLVSLMNFFFFFLGTLIKRRMSESPITRAKAMFFAAALPGTIPKKVGS